MHGGARGSGAQRGNQNALVHGRYTREAIEQRRLVRLIQAVDAALVAEMRVVEVVGRGADDEFDAAVQAAAGQRDRLTKAAAALERILVLTGRSDEARELLGDVPSLVGEAGVPPA